LISENNLEAVVANLLDEAHGRSSKRGRIVFPSGEVENISNLSGLCKSIESLVASE